MTGNFGGTVNFGGGPLTSASVSDAFVARFTMASTARFSRGDVDVDGDLTLGDAVAILGWLFLGDLELDCRDAADSDDNGAVELTDAVRILQFLFLGSGALPPPGPRCDEDPTDDRLDCRDFSCS